ncbi:MAG: ATP-binding protein [Longimicrobiales bacterium]|nr:ATP-binding protein [Longimicrobiales bacterium]
MRIRIHHTLFAGFLGVVGLVVFLMASLAGSRVRAELRGTFEAELGRELNLAGLFLAREDRASMGAVVDRVAAELGHRVTVIATDGTVLADSDVPAAALPAVENHATRPEVAGALAGGRSFDLRVSATVDDPFLYGAQLARVGQEEVVLRIAAPLVRVETAVALLQGRIVLTGLLAMALSLLVAWLLARGLARPLASLAEQARLLAAGNLGLRVPVDRRVRELDDLASAFNRLGEELQSRVGELSEERDAVQAVIDSLDQGVLALDAHGRITRWNRAAAQLLAFPPDLAPLTSAAALVRSVDLKEILAGAARGREIRREVRLGDRDVVVSTHPLGSGGGVAGLLDVSEIRRAERVRRDFVANASHELKTPLTSIRGFAETLFEGDPEPAVARTFLGSILNNTIRLQNMVDDLLDLSRLESGGWVADCRELEVARVAHEAFEPLADGALALERSFEVVGSGVAVADPAGLLQVFRNLYENALRHTDPGGSLSVAIREELEVVHVAVSDDGEGIPSKALPRIFERFFRADSSRARDQGGTGLGLAIVRHLITSMGGAVWAESELGSGTTVNFTLPRPGRS